MLSSLLIYFSLLGVLVFWSSKKVKTSSDFIIGNRSLNFWLTALAAHASDMSSWLFMGYPALIFVSGLFNSWVAVGLVICMWFNWKVVAVKLRKLTGEWNCATFSSFLHQRYDDKSGILQVTSAIFCFLFYVVYICSGLIGIGILGESLFGISYTTGILAGCCCVVLYVIFGGFITLAWVDFFQGIFLLAVVCISPLLIIGNLGGFDKFMSSLNSHPQALKFLPNSWADFGSMLVMIFGWGLGYFGQPHIVTKFMGIKDASEVSKSRNLGMTWMVLSLIGATLVGLVSIEFFSQSTLSDPQMVFIEMIKNSFSPMISGFILCAVLAATLNVMGAQLLILSSIVTEDFFKRLSINISSRKLLAISRLWIILAAFAALLIAYAKIGSIYHLVHYAWSGLGASFGPLLIVSLYSKRVNKHGALAAIFTGGIVAAIWPFLDDRISFKLDPLIPGCVLSLCSIFLVSFLTREKKEHHVPVSFLHNDSHAKNLK